MAVQGGAIESDTVLNSANERTRKKYCKPARDLRASTASSSVSNTQDGTWRRWKRKMLNPLKTRPIPSVPSERPVSPEAQAGFLSSIYFTWVAPLLHVGYKRPLELNDIWTVTPDRSVEVLMPKFQQNLACRSESHGRLNPLLMAGYDTFKTDILIGGACQLVTACLQVLNPFVLRFLIEFAQESYTAHHAGIQAPSIGRGVGLVLGIACMLTVQSICMSQFVYRGTLVGGQMRSTLIACVFQKALKLSGRAKAGTASVEGWSNARMNTLMATDTSRIDLAAGTIHRCWTAPIQILLALALLCYNLTHSALAGFAFICVVIPLLGRSIGVLQARRKSINKITDRRIGLINELFTSIRHIKLFAWESFFHSRIGKIRGHETYQIFQLLSMRNGILAIAVVTPGLASLLTFVTYSLTGHQLNAAPIFSSLALFNALNVPLEWLPIAIGQAVDASASVQRISDFLGAEEHVNTVEWNPQGDHAIHMGQASFIWEQSLLSKDSPEGISYVQSSTSSTTTASDPTKHGPGKVVETSPFALQDLELFVRRGELVAVIGAVGSGKSSFLSAIAGEMRKTSGHVSLGSSLSFCPQNVWIQNSSLRDNILFGNVFDEDRYQQTIKACALLPDLEVLPKGDLTEIGERGITLSGGQKQRINMARTVYANTEIVLLDDPLSAVDSYVGRHIMDQAICGVMKNKCRILATHQLNHLSRADRIVWMMDGHIHRIATFRDLLEEDASFKKLMELAVSKQAKSHNTDASQDQIREIEDSVQPASSSPLMQREDQSTRGIKWAVYRDYIQSTGSMFNVVLVCMNLAVAQGASVTTGLWLSWWISGRFSIARKDYIAGYAALSVLQTLVLFTYAASFAYLCTRASKNLAQRALSRILKAPISFFDTTPIGRIINRFTKDVDTMDIVLVDNLRVFLWMIFGMIAVFCLTIAYYYWFAITLLPLFVVFTFAAAYYKASARELKRHEAVLRSEVFSRFGEALPGTTTIRAFKLEGRFTAALVRALDSMDGAYFLTFANQRWLATRLDTLGNLLVFTIGILVVTSRISVSPAIAGLVLSYMLVIVQYVQLLVRQMAEVENNMNAAERLHFYSDQVPVEEQLNNAGMKVPQDWPNRGEIIFNSIEMCYRPELPLVLKGLSLHVGSNQHIAIVGRTGAGKSSILSSLLRLTELSRGSIVIDGIDISRISLRDLRSRMAVIPQDPVLFQGTVRSNLDPFASHSDLELWQVLRQVGMSKDEEVQSQGTVSLDTAVEDEGSNFSLGQRQLLSLARALVKGSQIIICDEATSAMDFETDRRIQKMFNSAFAKKTLICVAHRLNTILG